MPGGGEGRVGMSKPQTWYSFKVIHHLVVTSKAITALLTFTAACNVGTRSIRAYLPADTPRVLLPLFQTWPHSCLTAVATVAAPAHNPSTRACMLMYACARMCGMRMCVHAAGRPWAGLPATAVTWVCTASVRVYLVHL